ncbi:MAG: hypothetical protein H7255_15640 [Ramlibacter sp.]|nr:hypothetical protein [Ramlibacter sp.]
MSKSNQTLVEWLAVGALYAALVGAALYLGSEDLTLMAALLAIPLAAVLLVRPSMPLIDKLRLASVIAFAMPVLLCVVFAVQFPQRIPFFLFGGICGMVYMVCFDVFAKLLWMKRNAG